MIELKPLPIGIQTFRDLIANGYLYIDKTKWLYKLVRDPKGVYFLSRPRRFGKSLLISTLLEIFSGNRALFKGLWLYQSDYQWQKYPIIHLDFSLRRIQNATQLQAVLTDYLSDIAAQYDIMLKGQHYEQQLIGLIRDLVSLFEGSQVVILIDEYDKPILDNIESVAEAQQIRDVLKGFYTIIKSMDAYVRFVFLTGISKFSKVGVFSGLNNLEDLTLQPRYAAMLGITQEELERDLQPHMRTFAQYNGSSAIELKSQIQAWYNGFCFSANCVPVYNPFSLLLSLKQYRFSNYWFESGTPTFLLKLIQQRNYDIEQLGQLELNELAFSTYEVDRLQIVPLLFQTGYLTIKSYNSQTRRYRLSYPNYEVEYAFMSYLLGLFGQAEVGIATDYLGQLVQALQVVDWEQFFNILQTFLANIPYDLHIKQEKCYQTIFYLLFKLIGLEIGAEVHTNRGRIDAVIELETAIYLFEFKLQDSATEALQQIRSRDYYQRYCLSGKVLHLVGVKFDLMERCVAAWETETDINA